MEEEFQKESESNLPEELVRNPYDYITNYMEEVLPYTGKQVFQLLSLLPASLVIPDLYAKGQKIRSNINTLFLSPSGSGKSTVSQKMRDITYNPIDIRSITPAQLENKIDESPFFSLIIEDFHTMSQDPYLIKILEGMLGEEKRVQRETTNKQVDLSVDGVGLICGTPDDLASSLQGGLVFRLVPLVLMHSEEEHSEIGYEISMKMGKEDDESKEKEENIREFYNELARIQEGSHSNVESITGYYIPDKFKDEAFKTWDKATRTIRSNTNAPLNWFRSMQEFYRFLVSSAFLNVFNRKVENGILYPNGEDFKVARSLMKRDLETKYQIIRMHNFAKRTNTIKELNDLMEKAKVSEYGKKLANSVVKTTPSGKIRSAW